MNNDKQIECSHATIRFVNRHRIPDNDEMNMEQIKTERGEIPPDKIISNPPEELADLVGGHYFQIGSALIALFKEYANLQSGDKILDIGCGCGRIAVPLTNFLSQSGTYDGFDINRDAISWCQNEITPRFPNFHFRYEDIFNQFYNPGGAIKSGEFIFPFENNSFSFVILTSVFTHMVPEDMEHYLAETRRVLKKDGRCFITFFLINDESKHLIENNKSHIEFKYGPHYPSFFSRLTAPAKRYWTTHPSIAEHAVAYDERYIFQTFQNYGFEIIRPVHYGYWCQRKPAGEVGQDIIVASRR